MDISNLMDYVVLAVVAFCLGVGHIIKTGNFIPNKFIPLILSMAGIGFNICLSGFNVTAEIVLAGMMSGLASTGVYEAWVHMYLEPKQERLETKGE